MTQFKKVGAKIDGNAAKKIDEGSNYPLSHLRKVGNTSLNNL